MKKIYILLFSVIITCFITSTTRAQGTETFEAPLAIGSQTWTNAGLTFTTGTANFNTAEFANAGSQGSDRFLDNDADTGVNKTYSITISGGATLFTIQSIDIYVSSDPIGANPTDDGTMTFRGLDGGVEVFSYTKPTGTFPTTFPPNNGFFTLDFSAVPGLGDVSNMNIDELEISHAGAFQYVALDQFAFDNEVLNTDPPEVQSITVVGTPASTATSVDFLVTFNEDAFMVDTSDFGLDAVGTTGTISGISGSGTAYTVTVSAISGEGTISIDLIGGNDIEDSLGNSPSPPFTAGENHVVSRCFQETFESFTAGDIMWSSNGVTYSSGTANFDVENFANGGAGNSDQFLSNDADQGTGKIYTIAPTGPELFTVEALDVYLSSEVNGANPTDDGSITLEGRLSGSTLYTIQKTTGFPTNFTINNGFYTVDFATEGASDYSLTNIDELQITIGGAFIYIGLDNFEHCEEVTAAAPPIVQSIKLIGNPPANSASVDFEVIFNEDAVNVTADDFSLDLLGTATATINGVTGSGNTYTVDVNGISGEGSLRVDLNAGTDIEDTSGNTPPDPFTDGERFIVSICDVETFEGLANGTFAWTTNTVPWASQGAAFSVDEFIGAGAGGSDRYIDNVTSQGTGDINTIAITDTQMVKMGSMEVYVSSVLNGDNPTDDGTLTVRGKLDGATLYTVTKSTGFPVIFGSTQGFYLWDFATEGGTDWSTTDVDEIELELGGAFQYLAVDNFKFCMDPPDETEVALAGGTLTITDINGGVSDDDINLSINGANLRITNTVDRFTVSGAGVVEVDDNTVDVLLANITNGIVLDGVSGNDTVTNDASLVLSGAANGFTVENIMTFVQNQPIDAGGFVFIDVLGSTDLLLNSITAGNDLTISAQANILDNPGAVLNITGATNLFTPLDINLDNLSHIYSGPVDLDAEDIYFRGNASSPASAVEFVSVTANGGSVSPSLPFSGRAILRIDSGIIVLNGSATTTPSEFLTLQSGHGILQTAGSITTDLIQIFPGGQTATLNQPNNDANNIQLLNGSVSYTDIDDVTVSNATVNLETLSVTATDIDFSTNAVFNLNGAGSNVFTGNILSPIVGPVINQNNGPVSFVGGTVNLSNIQYNGAPGTTTNIDGTLATAGSQLTFNDLMVNSGDYQTNGVTTTVNGVAMFSATANLIGVGTIDGEVVIDNGGELAAGNSPGCLSTGNLSLLAGSTSTFEVTGVTPCTLHDQIQVTGTVSIDPAANIVFAVGYANAPADEIILILNDGADPISGTFNGYPEGTAVNFGAFSGFITYVGGDGNDVSIAADTTPPVITCPSDITQNNDPGICGAVVTFTVTATDNNPGVTLVVTPPSGSTFPVGTTLVTATATDAAGNTATCTFNVTVNDAEAPVVTCPADITVNNDPGVCGAVVTFTDPTVSDNCGGTMTMETFVFTGTTDTFVVPAGVTSITIESQGAQGGFNGGLGASISGTFAVTPGETFNLMVGGEGGSRTNNGGVGGGGGGSFVWNTSGPTLLIAAGGGGGGAGNGNGVPGPGSATNAPTDSTNGSGNGAGGAGGNGGAGGALVAVATCEAGAGGGAGWLSNGADGASPNAPLSGGGVNPLAGGAGGNEGPNCTFPPTGSAIGGFGGGGGGGGVSGAGGGGGGYNGGGGGNSWAGGNPPGWGAGGGGGSFNAGTSPTNTGGVRAGDGQIVISYTLPPVATQTAGLASGSTFPIGTTTNTFEYTDPSGNTASCSFTVTVNDNEDPVANCPADITVNNDPGNCGAVVTYTIPAATDNCPGVTVVGVPASGSTFLVGTTTVTVTATDAAGNTDVCTFTVTVNDTENPVVTCMDETIQLDATGSATLVVADVNGGVTDNCGVSGVGFLTPNSITTTFASNNSASGNMFDIVAINDIVVNSFDINLETGLTTDVEVYYKPGTWVGFDMDPSAWTLIGTVTGITSNGNDTPTPLNLTMGQGIPAGQTGAFYVTTTFVGFGTSDIRYTNGTVVGNVYASDGNLQFLEGAGKIYPFDATFTSRVFNGNIVYETLENSIDFDCSNTGPNTVQLTAMDTSGNLGMCTATVTVEDNIDPVSTCPADITVNNDPGICGAVVTYTIPAPTDNCPGVTTVGVPASGSTFPVGTTTVTVTATDASGNTDICTFTVTVTDNEPPVANCVAPFTLQLDATGNASITPADIDNGSTDNCGIASLAVSPSTFTCADVGPNTVTLTVTDVNGNSSTCTTVVTVEDNVAPIAVCMDITIDLDADGNATITPADVDGGSSDACGIASLSIDVDTFDCSDVGPNNVVLTVTDVNGNSSQCTAVVTVQDVTAPVMACPADIVAVAEPDICGIILTYADPIALDACGVASVVLTSGLPSGSVFPVGISTVEWTATDVNGNSSTCSFTVTVTDTTPPVAVCQDITVPLDATGNATITVADVDGGSFDNCAIDTMSIDIDTFDCSDVGPNNVTLTVTDIYGNVSSCIAVVTIEDVTDPMAVCQNITVQLDATGTVTINPADLDGGSTDVCGIDTAAYSVDIDTFDCSNVGDNPVVLTVTDVNGNTATCTAIVTVEDITEPDVVCQDITIELDENGLATIVADDVIASNTDACGIFETSIDISEFNCDDIGTPVLVTVFSEDVNGNISTCTAEVTVVDLLAPVVTCPEDQTVDPGGASDLYEVPDYLLTGEATAIDNCTDPLVITTQDPAPGTLLSEGTYTVTITAEDESGNIGTCTFELTVDSTLGTNDPKLDISTIIMYPNPAQAIVNISNPQAIPLENATIYDVTGRLVKTFDLRGMGTEKALDIATLASATYVVVIQSESGTLTKQLIKE